MPYVKMRMHLLNCWLPVACIYRHECFQCTAGLGSKPVETRVALSPDRGDNVTKNKPVILNLMICLDFPFLGGTIYIKPYNPKIEINVTYFEEC